MLSPCVSDLLTRLPTEPQINPRGRGLTSRRFGGGGCRETGLYVFSNITVQKGRIRVQLFFSRSSLVKVLFFMITVSLCLFILHHKYTRRSWFCTVEPLWTNRSLNISLFSHCPDCDVCWCNFVNPLQAPSQVLPTDGLMWFYLTSFSTSLQNK